MGASGDYQIFGSTAQTDIEVMIIRIDDLRAAGHVRQDGEQVVIQTNQRGSRVVTLCRERSHADEIRKRRIVGQEPPLSSNSERYPSSRGHNPNPSAPSAAVARSGAIRVLRDNMMGNLTDAVLQSGSGPHVAVGSLLCRTNLLPPLPKVA